MAMYLLFFGMYALIITWKLSYKGFQPGFQRRRETPLSPVGFLPTFLIVLALVLGLVLLIRSTPDLSFDLRLE